jgi:hypothetical protein
MSKFYRIFDDDLNESREDSELHLGIRSTIVREKVSLIYGSASEIRPKLGKVSRKVKPFKPSMKATILVVCMKFLIFSFIFSKPSKYIVLLST